MMLRPEDMSSNGRTSGPIAVERPTGGGGDVRVSGTAERDHERVIEQKEQGREADNRENGTGEECMKLEQEKDDERPEK